MEARHIGIGIVILIVGGIFGYIIAKNNIPEFSEDHSEVSQQQAADLTESGKYFLVPELGIRFQNVAGFTPEYVLVENTPVFFSKELLSLAARDPRFTGCIIEGFSSVSITSTEALPNDPVDQISIGKGRYINIAGPQAVCWNAPNLTAEQQGIDPGVKEYQNQANLFGAFISSAQAY
jgi:hypothetical protein